jgi:transaldolase
MKFFLDTANIDEIRQGVEMGMVDGITTNPSLVAKEGREFRAVLEDICELVDGPVSAEVVSTQFSGMIQEAHSLAEIHENIVVKVPMIFEGLKAIHQLSKEGIKVNVTLIFSASQALMAAKAGATYVSPFVGRLDDVSHPGMDVIQQIVTIFDNYDFNTQVLVASIRHPLHVVEAAMMGADVGTMPFKVLEQLIKHPLTDVGLARFLKDWEKLAV